MADILSQKQPHSCCKKVEEQDKPWTPKICCSTYAPI